MQNSFYVEISRARDRAGLVTDDREAVCERLEAVGLGNGAGRDTAKGRKHGKEPLTVDSPGRASERGVQGGVGVEDRRSRTRVVAASARTATAGHWLATPVSMDNGPPGRSCPQSECSRRPGRKDRHRRMVQRDRYVRRSRKRSLATLSSSDDVLKERSVLPKKPTACTIYSSRALSRD